MELIITKVDLTVKGTAAEIREAVPAVLATQLTVVETPTATVAPPTTPEAPTAPPEQVEAHAAPTPVAASVNDDHDEPSATVLELRPETFAGLSRAWQVSFPHVEEATWEDIPEEWRWEGDIGTVHIRREPWLEVAMCPTPPSRIGTRRLRQGRKEPNLRSAAVCQACVRHMARRVAEAQRGAAS